MPSPRTSAASRPASPPAADLPKICIVTAEEEFLDELTSELSPWFDLVTRDSYDDLARWTREAKVTAILLDIDTQGDDPHGGLPILEELRKLNQDLTLISLSRARTRAVEKQACAAGADAHFRNPVDLAELRLTLVDTLHRHAEDAVREQMRRQALEMSRFQDFVGASGPMRMVYDTIQQVADSSINVLIRGESGTGKELAARAIVASEPPSQQAIHSPELRSAP